MDIKRVLIVGPAYPFRGGIAEFNNNLCSTYLRLGIDCQVLSFSVQYPGILFPGSSQFENQQRVIDFQVNRVINSVNPFTWSKAARYIKKFSPDYVLVAYWIPFIGISTGFVMKKIKKQIPTLVLAHNIQPHDAKPFDRQITRFFLKQAKGVVLLSKAVEKELDMFNRSLPRMIGFHPIYDFGEKVDRQEAFNLLGIEPSKYVLFFGLIKKYKGLDVLLRAFATEILRNTDIKLIVAGEFYDNKKQYLDMIKELGISDRVKLFDYFIPTWQVRYFFSAADAVVLPYRSATQSGVTQVAYHFELPMIVSDVGALPDLVPDGKAGFVFKSEDYEQLAHKIVQLYEDNNLQRFSRFISERKREFSWEKLVEQINEFYKQL